MDIAPTDGVQLREMGNIGNSDDGGGTLDSAEHEPLDFDDSIGIHPLSI